jgi:hypothetical protein
MPFGVGWRSEVGVVRARRSVAIAPFAPTAHRARIDADLSARSSRSLTFPPHAGGRRRLSPPQLRWRPGPDPSGLVVNGCSDSLQVPGGQLGEDLHPLDRLLRALMGRRVQSHQRAEERAVRKNNRNTDV